MTQATDLDVRVVSYIGNTLTIILDSRRYCYEVSPYIYEHFEALLRHNKGRALAYIRGAEVTD